jgi:hypothetical protein
MTQTIQAVKLDDFPEYRSAEDKLRNLNADEARLKSAIADSERELRRDPNRLIPDERVVVRLKGQREDAIAIQRAISTQKQEVSRARTTASRGICDSVRPQHEAALADMARAIVAANRAALTAANIRDHLGADDVSTDTLPAIFFAELGQVSLEPSSRLYYFVQESLTRGLLTRTDVPREWLAHWQL